MACILLIDNDEDTRSSIAAMLSEEGHHVVSACDGRAGLRRVEAEEFDLIVTDLVMPDVEGIETIRLLRKLGKMTPILAISGGGCERQSRPYLQAARQLGADAALAKPFRLADLATVVARLTGTNASSAEARLSG